MDRLLKVLDNIKPLDNYFLKASQEILDNLTKPRGSLGRLEEMAQKYIAIRRDLKAKISHKFVFTFAGDHGVTDEAVSAYPREVTPQMVFNFLRRGAAINVIARHVGAEVLVVDMGVDYDFEDTPGLIIRKIRRGTGNMAKGPAMTRDEAIKALLVGIELAEEYAQKGADIFGTGDMGIGNTTPSAAILACLTGEVVENVAGRGTGVDNEGLARKIEVIKRALEINRPDPKDPLDVLAKVGGFEIAGIAGLIIGAAARRIPVVVDGFISGAGAMIAVALEPLIKNYIYVSHRSQERGHSLMLQRLGEKAILELNMRLGEGTGAALAMDLVEVSLKIFHEMATFDSAGVSKSTREEVG